MHVFFIQHINTYYNVNNYGITAIVKFLIVEIIHRVYHFIIYYIYDDKLRMFYNNDDHTNILWNK